MKSNRVNNRFQILQSMRNLAAFDVRVGGFRAPSTRDATDMDIAAISTPERHSPVAVTNPRRSNPGSTSHPAE